MKKIKDLITRVKKWFVCIKSDHKLEYENNTGYTNIFNKTKHTVPILYSICIFLICYHLHFLAIPIGAFVGYYFKDIIFINRYLISKKISSLIN